ncbi:MAG TPA: ECF transporter S component [Geobacterales bacterium]|nr:ECF transporter S component [Geobacterales bacterium]
MRSLQIAIIAVFAAIIYLLSTTVSNYISYPILPYLKFDPAEIVIILSLFLFGPAIAIILSVLHFILLHFPSTQYPIIGPGLKLLAELSTVFAAYLAFSFSKSRDIRVRLVYSLLLALVFRNLVMTLANYVILMTLFSGAVDYFYQGIATITGLSATSFTDKLFLILVFTAVYNSIHVFISILPAFVISIVPSMPQIVAPISKHWLYSMMQRNGK